MSQTIDTQHLNLNTAIENLQDTISLSETAIANIEKCRKYLDKKMQEPNAVYYGINTGFGSLCNIQIDASQIQELQENLVLSHACGIGNEVPQEIVKLMLQLKIKNFVYGNSGVSLEVVQRLVDMYNNNVLPVIYEQGSLGASGDLAPLAHLCLPLLGEGQVYYEGEKISSRELLQKLNWKPIALQSKEGLALLNGTQFMSSYGVYGLHKANILLKWANLIAAISIDAWHCLASPFLQQIHTIRNQKGQQQIAQEILNLLEGSEIQKQAKTQVQDPYSFRCIPQVHGASVDALNYCNTILENEINAVTDNPLVFPDDDIIVSGGNFHGQPLALALDFAAISIAEIGNISERRTYQLISGQRNLPPYLINSAGLDSGFMIPQYTAASIVSRNKQLCTPSSVDSIVSSNGQEDHVSMGANSAVKFLEVVNNVEKVLAIELMNAVQALEFRRPLKTSPQLEKIIADYRTKVSFVEKDRFLSPDIHKTVEFMRR